MTLCSGIRADSGRCRAQAIRGAEWCVNHHPDYEGARRRRNSKGGKRGGRGRPQAELSDVKRRLSDLVEDVLEGRKDRGDAAVAGQLLNTWIRAVGVELKVREQEELVREVEELRQMVETQRDRSA